MSPESSHGRSKCADRRKVERFGCLVPVLVFLLASTAAADEFSVVSYNIRSLPAVITGNDTRARVRRIPPLASSYDVAVLQEAFEYRRELRSLFRGHRTLGERGDSIANEARSASLFGFNLGSLIGLDLRYDSGLATFAADSIVASGTASTVAFESCSGWLGGRYDCWAAKGVQCDSLRLPSGVDVDVCNTHLDSGNAAADQRAREAQLEQIAGLIETRSSPNALLVVGDLNLSLPCKGDSVRFANARSLERFVARLGLHDSGACGHDSRWDDLRDDFILYRSGSSSTLRLLEAGEDLRFTHGGTPLSDHPALSARFTLDPTNPPPTPTPTE